MAEPSRARSDDGSGSWGSYQWRRARPVSWDSAGSPINRTICDGAESGAEATVPLMKHLTIQIAAPGQAILPQSSICFGCWSAQHGIWADIAICVDIVTTPAAIAPAPKGAATGGCDQPTIARIGKSRTEPSPNHARIDLISSAAKKRRRLHFCATGRAAINSATSPLQPVPMASINQRAKGGQLAYPARRIGRSPATPCRRQRSKTPTARAMHRPALSHQASSGR